MRRSRACPWASRFLHVCRRRGALVAAPFATALTGAFMTQVGAYKPRPILIAVVTSCLAMEGVKYLIASGKQAQPGAATARE